MKKLFHPVHCLYYLHVKNNALSGDTEPERQDSLIEIQKYIINFIKLLIKIQDRSKDIKLKQKINIWLKHN